MGCDIHVYAEAKANGRWKVLAPDGAWEHAPYEVPWDRDYRQFAFLSGVRNYHEIAPIAEPRGVPIDASHRTFAEHEEENGHTASWLTLAELRAFEYDQTTEQRTSFLPGGQSITTTYRKFLGPEFFASLERLERMGAERIVFWFDN